LAHLPAPPTPLHAPPATVGQAVSACLHARMRLLLTLARHAPASAEVRNRTNVDAHPRHAVIALRGAANSIALSFAALLHVECVLLIDQASHSCSMSLVFGLRFAA